MPRATVSRKQQRTIENGLSIVDPLDKTLSEVPKAEGSSLADSQPVHPGVTVCGEPVLAAGLRNQGFK
eukprot:528504-Karenia_brevis.AAC.1